MFDKIFDRMFDNIGKKIKILAVIITVVCMIFFIILGIGVISSPEKNSLLYGLIIIIAGCLVSWIAAFILYGYGELIDKTMETAQNTERLLILAVAETIEKSELKDSTIEELKQQVIQQISVSIYNK